ncbi:MAG: glutamine synthetase [Bacteriovoracaceae bacterium]|nr:glutamine synthetase [Bacteriovoracaceae bacterium]
MNMPKSELNITKLSDIIGKSPEMFQREDLLKAISEHDIKQLNLHYSGLDGRLKELKVPINDLPYAELILAEGERIDGSSIFKQIVDSSHSDLYILPIYKTAFLSPFEHKTLGIMCRFLDKDGNIASFTPDSILLRAHEHFKNKTGYSLNALGELEFYIIYNKEEELFKGAKQGSYHQSAPFVKRKDMLNEIMRIISALTGAVKYSHAEVGFIECLKSHNPEIAGKSCEQFEIEFLPRSIDEMGAHLTLAKWIVRNVAHRWGCSVTFAPKLEEGIAGNGLHLHLELSKNGKNQMTDHSGALSVDAQKLIGGLCKYAGSISAFGNSVSSAYLRLVLNQEAPTKICWSLFNRSALIRVPLGWNNTGNMAKTVNPIQENDYKNSCGTRQTIELRSPDGSAYINLLLAAVTMAAEYGLTSTESLEYAQKRNVSKNIFDTKVLPSHLETLPKSCAESADILLQQREQYEKFDIFPKEMIDYVTKQLYKEDDRNINDRFSHLSADERLFETRKLMHKDLHKH